MVATTAGGRGLWLRQIDSTAGQMLAGTENAEYPFWAPDSRRIGFFSRGRLKTVDIESGGVKDLAAAQAPRGGAWSPSDDLGSVTQPHLYYAALQYYTPGMTLAIRTSGDPQPVLPAVLQVIRQLDATMPLPTPQTMLEVLSGNLWTARLAALLLAVFGLLAVTLTTVGIYGVMAYSVSRRTQEIGIRMALGAAHADVMRMVLRQGAKLTLLGVAIGLAAAFGATRLIANLLFVSPTDGWTFAAVSMLLAAVAMTASFLPARRAARVDPLVALRRDC